MFFRSDSRPERDMPLIDVRSPLILRSLSIMGYDGANIGRLDLLLPGEVLRRYESLAKFPFLSANVVDDAGKAPFRPYLVSEFDGFTVGVFGLVSERPLPGSASALSDLQVTDPVAAAKGAVGELRARGCDLVVALTSLGLEEDRRMAREVKGIDVILGGLDRRVLYQPVTEGDTLIVQAGSKGMRLGELDLEFLPGRGGPWVSRGSSGGEGPRQFAWSPVSLSDRIVDHVEIAALLEGYRSELKEREVARRLSPAPAASSLFTGAASCRECHSDEAGLWERSGHAHAFETLVAKRQDGNPVCLECHVTAFARPGGYTPGGSPDLGGVQCEACHGPGRDHPGRGGVSRLVPEGVCRRCHNTENSPAFDYERYLKRLGDHAAGYFRRRP